MEPHRPSDRLKTARENSGFGTAAEFAQRHGLTESTYRSHENGTRELTLAAAKRYGRLLGIKWLDLMGEDAGRQVSAVQPGAASTGASINSPTQNDTPFVPSAAKVPTDGLIKVLGMAECGPDGESLWNGDVVDYVPRPPNLSGATRAYAVFAQGTSMEPRYLAGELVYIHPDKPVTPGCFVLVQMVPKEDGLPPRAFLKRLVKRSGAKIVLQQFDPAKTFDIKASDVVSMHRVVGSGEA